MNSLKGEVTKRNLDEHDTASTFGFQAINCIKNGGNALKISVKLCFQL